jgi:hypothetical protein
MCSKTIEKCVLITPNLSLSNSLPSAMVTRTPRTAGGINDAQT